MKTPRTFLHTEIKVMTRHLPSGIPSLRWGNTGCVSILPPLCFLVGRGRWLWFRAALVLLSVENGLVGRGLWEEGKAFPEMKSKGVDMENVPITLYFCLALCLCFYETTQHYLLLVNAPTDVVQRHKTQLLISMNCINSCLEFIHFWIC